MGKNTINDTVYQLNKMFGIENIKKIDELPYIKNNIVSTGIMGLDIALGIGGIKKGSIVEIYAPESAGKTTLALQLCKQYQKEKPVLYIDTERTLTRETIESMGVESNNFYLMYVDNLEMALEVCKTVALDGTFSAIVIDSLAGLVPKAQIDGNVGDCHVGLFSRIMSETLPVLTTYLDNSGCTLIVITQLREKTNVMFGNPERATGGRALKYYATIRLDVRRIESIKLGGEEVGCTTRIKVVKNKIATPFKSTEFDLMFGEGISVEGDILDRATENNIISRVGISYVYNGKKIGSNRIAAKGYLKEHKNISSEIENKLREIYKIA